MNEETIKISIAGLTAAEANAFTEFLKRATFADYREHATSDEEANMMVSAGGAIREALRGAGFDPR
jgi:hypothetical protein